MISKRRLRVLDQLPIDFSSSGMSQPAAQEPGPALGQVQAPGPAEVQVPGPAQVPEQGEANGGPPALGVGDDRPRIKTRGNNFELVQGVRHGSKLITSEGYSYLQERYRIGLGGIVTFYMKCKDPECSARGKIKNNQFILTSDENKHTCNARQHGNYNEVCRLEALTRMKNRASREATGFRVMTK